MNRLSISVCFPLASAKDTLAEALLSAIDQSAPPAEVIIIDQSQDHSVFLIAKNIIEHTQPGLRINYIHTSIKGLVHAKSIAVQVFNSDVLLFGEDDMIFDRNYFQEVLTSFSNYPTLMGVSSLIDEPPFTTSQRLKNLITYHSKLLIDNRQIFSRLMHISNNIIFSPKLYGGSSAWRREVFRVVNFEPNLILHFTEDIYFSHKVNSTFGPCSTALLPLPKSTHRSETNLLRYRADIFRQRVFEELQFVITFSESSFSRCKDSAIVVLTRLTEATFLAPWTSTPLLLFAIFSALLDSFFGSYPYQTTTYANSNLDHINPQTKL